MLFSIIVPVYNTEDFLKECIESALMQNCDKFEIILIDDGSSDLSGEICDKYGEQDLRIKVIHKKNGGHISARQMGIEIANGEYILCMDSDDYLALGILDKLAQIIDFCNPEMIIFDYYRILDEELILHTEGLKEGLYVSDFVFLDKVIYDRNKKGLNWGNVSFSLWNKAVKRQIFMKSHLAIPQGVRYGEDFVCIMNELINCESIYVLHFPGYYYRINSNSLTNKINLNDMNNIYKVIDAISILNIVDFEKQICVYYINMMWTVLVGFGKNNKYTEYKLFVEKEYNIEYDYLLKYINTRKLSFVEKIRFYLCKFHLWFIIYGISRIYF